MHAPKVLQVQSHVATVNGYIPPALDYYDTLHAARERGRANAYWNFCSSPAAGLDPSHGEFGKYRWFYGENEYRMTEWCKETGVMVFHVV